MNGIEIIKRCNHCGVELTPDEVNLCEDCWNDGTVELFDNGLLPDDVFNLEG